MSVACGGNSRRVAGDPVGSISVLGLIFLAGGGHRQRRQRKVTGYATFDASERLLLPERQSAR